MENIFTISRRHNGFCLTEYYDFVPPMNELKLKGHETILVEKVYVCCNNVNAIIHICMCNITYGIANKIPCDYANTCACP